MEWVCVDWSGFSVTNISSVGVPVSILLSNIRIICSTVDCFRTSHILFIQKQDLVGVQRSSQKFVSICFGIVLVQNKSFDCFRYFLRRWLPCSFGNFLDKNLPHLSSIRFNLWHILAGSCVGTVTFCKLKHQSSFCGYDFYCILLASLLFDPFKEKAIAGFSCIRYSFRALSSQNSTHLSIETLKTDDWLYEKPSRIRLR